MGPAIVKFSTWTRDSIDIILDFILIDFLNEIEMVFMPVLRGRTGNM